MATRSVMGETSPAPNRRPRGFQLLVLANDMLSVHALPGRGAVILGRGEDADIVLEDPHVSRRHARIHVGDAIEIEDLAGRNGTFVRGERLAMGRRTPVSPGEAVGIGETIIVVQPRHGREHGDLLRLDGLVAEGASALTRVPRHVVINDPAMRHLYGLAALAATSNINILILGETGVGKDVLAQTIHACSGRHQGPMVCLNCATFTEALLESELFGHEKGAFTGAVQSKPGLLETASGGTAFLDEVGDMSAALQARLLRVLDTREVRRLGSVRGRTIDVRIVSATNRDLQNDVERGRFRKDLYFRLNGLTLQVPALRARKGDIAPLAAAFVTAAAQAHRREKEPRLTAPAMASLERYHWPGNVRQLRSVIDLAVLLCRKADIGPEHLVFEPMSTGALPATWRPEPPPSSPIRESDRTDGAAENARPPSPGRGAVAGESRDVKAEMAAIERQRIMEAMQRFGGNQTQAARYLGIARRTLINRLDVYGSTRPRKRRPG